MANHREKHIIPFETTSVRVKLLLQSFSQTQMKYDTKEA